jgi:hypothetical protein
MASSPLGSKWTIRCRKSQQCITTCFAYIFPLEDDFNVDDLHDALFFGAKISGDTFTRNCSHSRRFHLGKQASVLIVDICPSALGIAVQRLCSGKKPSCCKLCCRHFSSRAGRNVPLPMFLPTLNSAEEQFSHRHTLQRQCLKEAHCRMCPQKFVPQCAFCTQL